jgi:hypothetical protein
VPGIDVGVEIVLGQLVNDFDASFIGKAGDLASNLGEPERVFRINHEDRGLRTIDEILVLPPPGRSVHANQAILDIGPHRCYLRLAVWLDSCQHCQDGSIEKVDMAVRDL